MIIQLQKETKKLKDPKREKSFRWFFKTGKGEYGEGDLFYGLTVPVCRNLAKKYREMPLAETSKLLKSKIHEERLIALLILVGQYTRLRKNPSEARKIYRFYLSHTKGINNWDLVDLSCHHIVGDFLLDKDWGVLKKLARSKNIWERRIAMISTFAFLAKKDPKPTLAIAEILVNDKHDLIHKAVGWGLREVGKRCSEDEERKFLDKYASTMPRTMLRYAIERFDDKTRGYYLQIKQRAD